MKLLTVQDSRTQKEFLRLPLKIYKDDPLWIQPWDHDVEAVFDKSKNKYFRHGELERWILVNDQNKTIGRVAAFINKREAKKHDQPTGGMGFFECVDNQEAAFMLFDRCKEWLQARGMEAMDGPINFGEKDKFWGLLVKTSTAPLYGMNHHPMYYQKFFEAYGFQTFYEQYCFSRGVLDDIDPRYTDMADRLMENPEYTFPRFSKKKLEKYAEDFREIYNRAWSKTPAFQPMRKIQAVALINQLKPILDEDTIVFCYHNGEPVGFFISIPELNQVIKHLNGKFNWWSKVKFFYHLKIKRVNKLFGMVYGVVPEYQRKGVEAAMVRSAQFTHQRIKRYDQFEMGWLGDFNPTMMRIADMLYCDRSKILVTYRKLFDETKPFKRRPIIGKKWVPREEREKQN
ncbi:MAG: hypothetical protein AAGI38_22255 [Bacteroidota bacterium]